MASSKSRQRALARAKVERQIARRAAQARKRRQLQAGIGVTLAVLLVVAGVVWATGGFKKDRKPTAAGQCAWTPQDAAGSANLRDIGMPPTKGIARDRTRLMTITTSQGVIETVLDGTKAPCTAASFAYLAEKRFFDNTTCHRLVDTGISVLQCGDPSGTGSGGPAYKFPDEFLPAGPEPPAGASPDATPSPDAAQAPPYPRGVLAMANSGPDTNGSQFFIVYKDSPLPPKYTIFGTVTKGLDVVEKIAAGGHDGAFEQQAGGGHPKIEVTIQSLTVGPPGSAAPATEAPPIPATPGAHRATPATPATPGAHRANTS